MCSFLKDLSQNHCSTGHARRNTWAGDRAKDPLYPRFVVRQAHTSTLVRTFAYRYVRVITFSVVVRSSQSADMCLSCLKSIERL